MQGMPEYLILGGDRISVERVAREIVDTPADRCDGEFEVATARIRVRDDAMAEPAIKILGHEIAHYFLYWGGLHNGIAAAGKDEENGKLLVEGVCDMFGSALVQVIKDNPKLVQHIFEEYRVGYDVIKRPTYSTGVSPRPSDFVNPTCGCNVCNEDRVDTTGVVYR